MLLVDAYFGSYSDMMFRPEGTPPVEVTKPVTPLLTIFACVSENL